MYDRNSYCLPTKRLRHTHRETLSHQIPDVYHCQFCPSYHITCNTHYNKNVRFVRELCTNKLQHCNTLELNDVTRYGYVRMRVCAIFSYKYYVCNADKQT